MSKKIIVLALIALILNIFSYESICASDKVVLISVPSDIWHQNIYLMADRISWMHYENFSVQVGDMGEYIYSFPEWYHGKYDPSLYKEDLNKDSLDDIIVVLNNDKAASSKPDREIHVLNQIHDPYRRYQEAFIEPVEDILNHSVKMQLKNNTLTILINNKRLHFDISRLKYQNPREPAPSIKTTDYAIKNSKLINTIRVYVTQDESVTGGFIGTLEVEYYWDGEIYKSRSIKFRPFTGAE